MDRDGKIEVAFEKALFAARWLVAPIYVGLIFCLVMLVVILVKYMALVGQQILTINMHDAIVATLSFIDLTLIANLVLIVLYTGYSSFVSRLNIDEGTVKANAPVGNQVRIGQGDAPSAQAR